jgi:hypothetical protein
VERRISGGKEGDIRKRTTRKGFNKEKLDLAVSLLSFIRADYSLSNRLCDQFTFNNLNFGGGTLNDK